VVKTGCAGVAGTGAAAANRACASVNSVNDENRSIEVDSQLSRILTSDLSITFANIASICTNVF